MNAVKMKKWSKQFSSDIEPVHRQLSAWRRVRKHREAIPQNLWMLMVGLARQHGVSRVCQALRINYYSLKERVEVSHRSGKSPETTRFVEVKLPKPVEQPGCVIELEDGSGAKMTLRFSQQEAADTAVTLAERFWRRNR